MIIVLTLSQLLASSILKTKFLLFKMAGLLTHLLVSLTLALVLFYLFKNWIYSVAVAVGQLAPDILDFGITGLRFGHLNPSRIILDPWFYPLKIFGHNFFNWFTMGIVVVIIAFLFYKFKKIRRKVLFLIAIVCGLFLIGVAVHLCLDFLIQETNHWI